MELTAKVLVIRAERCLCFVILDEEDYDWASQWRWFVTWDKHRRKMYATRNTSYVGPDGERRQVKIWLHKEILKRAGKRRRDQRYTIGDHKDGNSLNNTRANLRWATPKMNRKTAGGKNRIKRRCARRMTLTTQQSGHVEAAGR